jgi:hypothetical protein
MMVLTFEGARSGKAYSFPVGYAEGPEGLVTFTRFSWWKTSARRGRCRSGCGGARCEGPRLR